MAHGVRFGGRGLMPHFADRIAPGRVGGMLDDDTGKILAPVVIVWQLTVCSLSPRSCLSISRYAETSGLLRMHGAGACAAFPTLLARGHVFLAVPPRPWIPRVGRSREASCHRVAHADVEYAGLYLDGASEPFIDPSRHISDWSPAAFSSRPLSLIRGLLSSAACRPPRIRA